MNYLYIKFTIFTNYYPKKWLGESLSRYLVFLVILDFRIDFSTFYTSQVEHGLVYII